MNMHGWPWPEVRPNGTAGRLGSLPVAFSAEFDIQGAQVLPVGQTSSNRSKTTPVSSENVRPIAVH